VPFDLAISSLSEEGGIHNCEIHQACDLAQIRHLT